MIQGKKVIAVIPARGGSKRLPGKNIKPLAGKPLIAWTIEAAKKSKYIDRLILSTDAQEIVEVAKKYDCEVPFLRPPELATDEASSNDVVLHALENEVDNYDIVIALQPTSPLRTENHIDEALIYMIENDYKTIVSVTQAKKTLKWHYTIDYNGKLKPFCYECCQKLNSWDNETTYVPNGAVYMSYVDVYIKTKTFYNHETIAYEMSYKSSVDIDGLIDFYVAEALLKSASIN